jgi:outer membrane protein
VNLKFRKMQSISLINFIKMRIFAIQFIKLVKKNHFLKILSLDFLNLASVFKLQISNFKFQTSFFILLSSLFCFPSYSQTYTLEQVILLAQKNSPEAMKIKTNKVNKYWQWKTYKAEYMPQLVLNATLPSYQKQNIAVRQGDGSIIYQSINQSNIYSVLSLEQNIGITGGKLFLSTDLNRLDDFDKKNSSYSGSPFFIGLEQPLFAFNNLKWMNRIEPLKYEESIKECIEGNEKIAYNTSVKYFELLISQINFQIASTNKANADTIYKIGQEKFAMGKISKDELLQLKYGVISAQKSMATANLSIKTSLLDLNSFIGLTETENLLLALPDSIFRFQIDDSLAVSMALENSKLSLEYKREILEARRDNEKAKKESRLNASLYVSYGQTNVANYASGVYENPQTLQTLNIGLRVPILDWGRARSKRKTAEANLNLTEYTVKQDEINFRQQVITSIEKFRMLQDFIEYTHEADQTAAERYEIARLRYIAGDISLTDYNIALQEKDLGKQDYIVALRDYWLIYYTTRILTLYDFKNNEKILIRSSGL